MKIIFLTIIVYAFCFYPVFGFKITENLIFQTKAKKNLESATKEFQKALSEKDFEKLVNLMDFPAKIEADSTVEKREKEIAVIKQLFEDARSAGVSFSVKLDQPKSIVKIGTELFSIIPQYTITKADGKSNVDSNKNIPAGEYTGLSYYIAISRDKGRTWKFWDGLLIDSFKETFPKAGKRIKFPEIQKTSFFNKND